MECPKCGGAKVVAKGRRYALYPYGLVATIGVVFALFHQAADPYVYVCRDCSEEFRKRTPVGWCCVPLMIIAAGFTGLFYLAGIAGIVLGLMWGD